MRKTRLFVALLLLSLFASAQSFADTRKVFAGGWYAEACPNGEYVALVTGSHVETNAGRVPLPGNQDTLYLRSACDGSGRLVGVGHVDDHAYQWAGAWSVQGLAFGVNPVIYQGAALVVVHGPGPTGSQGWRYVSDAGALVSGDSTYADKARHIWEFTTRGDVTCGQGADEDPGTQGGGLQCLIAGRRVLVEAGVNRFVRFNQAGNSYAFGWVRQDLRQSVLRWMTRAELDALPTYHFLTDPVDPVDPVDPDPIEPPAQECGEVPAAGQAALRQLWARPDVNALVRSANDDDRRASARMFAEQMAYTVDKAWGTKNAGGGRPPSKDAIARYVGATLCGWDIVNGSTRELAFGHGEPLPGQELIKVSPVNHLGGKPVDPDPVDPPTSAIEVRLAVLEAQIEQLKARIVVLEARPAPAAGVQEDRVRALILDYFSRAAVEGSTGGTWGHNHRIGLGIVVK